MYHGTALVPKRASANNRLMAPPARKTRTRRYNPTQSYESNISRNQLHDPLSQSLRERFQANSNSVVMSGAKDESNYHLAMKPSTGESSETSLVGAISAIHDSLAMDTTAPSDNTLKRLDSAGLAEKRESYQTTSSDAARANALSCSLADIAGNIREQSKRHLARHAVSESNKTETSSSNNDGSDPEQNTSVVAVTGSTTNSDSNNNAFQEDEEEAFSSLPSRWSEATQSHRSRQGSGRIRKVRVREANSGADETSERMPTHHARVVAAPDAPRLDADISSPTGDVRNLVEPGKEPALHTIRSTMSRIMKMRQQGSETWSDKPRKRKHAASREVNSSKEEVTIDKALTKERLSAAALDNGSSSGSGTEGGYAGSASANEDNNGSSSPSVSSSDDSLQKKKKARRAKEKGAFKSTSDPRRPMLLNTKQDSGVSSDLADFGSSASDNEVSDIFMAAFAPSPSPSRSPSISSDSQDESVERGAPWPPVPLHVSEPRQHRTTFVDAANDELIGGKAPILSVGCDIMAHVLTFLEPPDILDVLTMPLSKDYLFSFTRQPELWRVLCLLDPFKAQVESNGNESSDDSDFAGNIETELRVTFGKHRLLYTSFVRCMRYLTRIKDDAVNGRPPSVIDYGSGPATFKNIETNQNLKEFLARARGITVSDNSLSGEVHVPGACVGKLARRRGKSSQKMHRFAWPSGDGCDHKQTMMKKRRRTETDKTKANKKKKKVTYGHSILTQRILGPTADGTAGTAVELPWSCAIYSIVNWMVAFSDVEGIQIMCMKVLPSLLDDEQQRITAQRAGLTDIIFRAMVMFPDSSELHTAACHTIVLLARPLGGREGMLFHTSMVNASGIFSIENGGAAESGRNGIAVLLDSMRRFRDNEALQAMSCWSLVNVALAPAQKEMLVRLGAIEVTAAAMQSHPFNAEVQFRALFALVNLVIPSVSLTQEDGNDQRDNSSAEDSSERDILDENVGMIVQLVVQSMKNFCASEAILNRACLVLHNLSLTPDYHSDLLWTPNCYQMLEWCLANYPTDQVLQQSAAGTLHRLQSTLSGDENLRTRFMASLQSQQQLSLEQAHREAGALHTQVSAAAP